MYKYAVLIALVIAIVPSCTQNDDRPVAKIGQETISRPEFEQRFKIELAKYPPLAQKDLERIGAIKKSILDDLIRDRILYLTANAAGLSIPEEELVKELIRFKSRYTEASFRKMLEIKGVKYDRWREEKRREFLIDRLIQKEVAEKINISDADIKKYYNRRKKDFMHGDEVHARQIVVDDLKKAEELHEKVAAGENFAAIAQEFSIAPEGKRGGDLGWFPSGIMPRAFDEACFPLPAGAISPVVKTEFGYHIFKVMERREASIVPLKDVRDKIIIRLQQERMENAYKNWFEGLREKTKVEVFEDVLKEII